MLILSQKIGHWSDPLTPVQSKTECIGYASGDWPWPANGGWKTCNQWKTSFRHMEVEGYFDFEGPDNLGDDVKKAVSDCALVAVAAGGVIGAITDGAGAVPAAQTAFLACMKVKGIQELDKYSISYRSSAGWSDWG